MIDIGLEAKDAGVQKLIEPNANFCEPNFCDRICKEDKYKRGICDTEGGPDVHCFCHID